MPEEVEHQFAGHSITPADGWHEVPGVPRAAEQGQDVPAYREDRRGDEQDEAEPDEQESVGYRPCPDGGASQGQEEEYPGGLARGLGPPVVPPRGKQVVSRAHGLTSSP